MATFLCGRRQNTTALAGDIYYERYNLFEEAGIVIAFPQRDIHIDSLGPLDVRLLPEEPKSEKDA